MKYLSDYTEEAQTKAFEEYGVFFAFSKQQFEDGCKKVGADKDNKVCDLGGGCYCLSKNADKVIKALDNIQKDAITQDIKENGIENIIRRELGNHEAQITCSISDTVDALEGYGISKEAIAKYYKEVYLPLCIENDWF